MIHIFKILPHSERFRFKILLMSLGLVLMWGFAGNLRAQPDRLSASGSEYGNAPFVVLSDKKKVSFDDHGRMRTRRELLCKVLNENGVDSLRHFAIDFDARTDTVILETAEARREGGAWITAGETGNIHQEAGKWIREGASFPLPTIRPEARKAPAYGEYQQQKVLFPELAIGTIAFLAYRVEPRSGAVEVNEQKRGGVELFGGYVPIREKQFTIEFPAKHPVKYAMQNSDIKPTISETGEGKILTWTLRECEQIIPGPQTVNIANIVPRLLWTQFSDWEELGTYAGNLFWEKVDSSRAAVDGFMQITSWQLNGTPAAMNATLWTLANVRNVDLPLNLTGYAPMSADRVWHNRYASSLDKAVFLAALLRVYGFATVPVLVPFENEPFSEVPDLEQFRQVILAVPTGDDTLWLDPSAEFCPPGELPYACTYGNGCMLVAGAPLLVHVPYAGLSTPTHSEIRGSLSLAGDFSGFAECAPQGDQAGEARRLFMNAGNTERDVWARAAVQAIGPTATVSDFSVSNVADLASPVKIRMQFDSPDFAAPKRDSLLITVPYNPFDFAECAFDTESYVRYPQGFSTHGKMVTEYGITLPLGYKPALAPAAVIIENPYVYVELSSRVLPQGFELTETIQTKADVVPVGDCAAVRDAFRALADPSHRRFVAVKETTSRTKTLGTKKHHR
jgi:hypothetical protein